MLVSYVGADVDSKMTDLVVERRGKVVAKYRVPTTISAIREVLEKIPRPCELAFEEGSMAQWMYRNLKPHVDRLVVCDPRRNDLISRDGDSDDVIDATKLAALLRGGFLREVHHSDDDAHVELKQWMGLYHDRVREAVRNLNKLRGRCRMFGHKPKAVVLRKEGAREEWLRQWKDSPLAAQMELLWVGYDATAKQVKLARKQVEQRTKSLEIVQRWQVLPGVGLIRASTLYAYLETPWRFATDRKLWKYCGVGLVRATSGKDKNGKPKVGHLELVWQVNKRLKDATMGAATSAIRMNGNPFSEYYQDLCRSGITPGNARHTVARKLLSVMFGMWKNGMAYDASWVRGPRNDKSQVTSRAGR